MVSVESSLAENQYVSSSSSTVIERDDASIESVSEFEGLMSEAQDMQETQEESIDLKDYIVKSIIDKSFDPAGEFFKDMIDELSEG